MGPETPADWLCQGQLLEAQDTAAAFAGAVQCYDRTIKLLHALPVEQVRRELGIAWMNRGNARQKQPDSAAASDAVCAYDEAIALLGALPTAGDPTLRNSLGAAWMNRGHAQQRIGTVQSLTAALQSHDQAIALLQSLPLDQFPSFRLNLAAAWLNRAQALLAFVPADATAAYAAARQAFDLTAESGRADPLVAEVALKAHHTLCAALSNQLAKGATAALIAETGDTIDGALALVRHWEQRGVRSFRPLAVTLCRFGAQFYLAHQPRFLAEFLLETLDPARAPGALPDSAELQAIAITTLAQARADAYNRSLLAPGDALLRQLRQELEAAEIFVAGLHAPQPAGAPGSAPS